MGLLAGIILAALLTDVFSLHIATGMVAVEACLISGIAIAVLIFNRVSVGNLPDIDHIIGTRLGAASG